MTNKCMNAEWAGVQGFNMAVQQASTQLPKNPTELDHLINHRLNSDLKARHNSPAFNHNPSLLSVALFTS